jgi:hypothetical protein
MTPESREERRERLREASREAAAKADEVTSSDLAALQRATATDLQALRPKVSDPALYDQLIAAVAESTRKNESLAQLRDRISQLGAGAAKLVAEAAALARG